ESKGLLFIILATAVLIAGGFINGVITAMNHGERNPLGSLITIAGFVLYMVGVFQMKSDLEDYYNSTESINLRLNGVMVFFFNVYYFQHHFSRIAQWKKTGVLRPQS
ncbi:MAG TPA: hypothetical protein VGK01_09970, partial [Candidatus Angelobacter sp.]